MNFQKTLFFKVLLPFGVGGGVLLFLHTLLLAFLGKNPLGGYRDLDLLLFVIIIAIMLVRYNFLTQNNPLFWEVFLSAYVCFMVALLVYLLSTYVWIIAKPEILTEYANLKREYVLENKADFIQNIGQKGYEDTLKALTVITPKDIFVDQLLKKGAAGLVISAFLSILFRLATFITVQRTKTSQKS
jgi:hypothetical protein